MPRRSLLRTVLAISGGTCQACPGDANPRTHTRTHTLYACHCYTHFTFCLFNYKSNFFISIEAELSSPDMLTYFLIWFSIFSPLVVNVRPLAPMTNDKLDLQECLEHGRTAKVCVCVCLCLLLCVVSNFLTSRKQDWGFRKFSIYCFFLQCVIDKKKSKSLEMGQWCQIMNWWVCSL